MTKRILTGFVRCCAVTGLLFAGVTTSEAAPLTLTDNGDSVELCVPGAMTCGTAGLSNWILGGSPHTFQQWFSYEAEADYSGPHPPATSGTIDTISAPTVTHLTPSTASVAYLGSLFGLQVNYALTGPGAPVSPRITEAITLTNLSYWFMNVHITDGLNVNEWMYVAPYGTTTLNAVYTANPEPMTIVLLGTGLAVAARARRRRSTLA
jgi:hypothetical protein